MVNSSSNLQVVAGCVIAHVPIVLAPRLALREDSYVHNDMYWLPDVAAESRFLEEIIASQRANNLSRHFWYLHKDKRFPQRIV